MRGLNSAARREAVKLIVQQARPHIVCLQETKLDAIGGPLVMEFLGYNLNPGSWRDEQDLEDWYNQAFGTGGRRGQTLVILTLWIIWNRRNAVIFRGCWKTPQAVVTKIKEMAQQWSLAGCKALRQTMVVQVVSYVNKPHAA